MMLFRIVFAVFFGLAAPTHNAAAQTSSPDQNATGVISAATLVSDADLPLTVSVGPVAAKLTATLPSGLHPAGASAFAQLVLSSEAGGRKGVSAFLRVEAEHGEILGVSGGGVEAVREGAGYLARVSGIRKENSRTVLIEMRLRAVEGQPPNRLTLTLSADDANSDRPQNAAHGGALAKSVTLSWPIADCGGQYHAALKRIGEAGGNSLRQTWRAATRPDESIARDWFFRPSIPKRTTRRQALSETSAISANDARAVYLEAGQLSRAGYDSSLRQDGAYGWIVSKVATDLQKYFAQDLNPALCTGAIGFAEYYEKQLAPIRKRQERLVELAGKASQLAQEKAETVFAMARALPGGHPAWGGAKLVSLRPAVREAGELKALVADLARAADYDPGIQADVAAAANAYQALMVLDRAGLEKSGAGKALRGALREALAAVEAAARLGLFVERQQSFSRAFFGSLEAIRSAHSQHCVCGS